MQDYTRPHISRITRHYLNDIGIQVLDWPPESRDLNPTERMRGKLGRRVTQSYGEFQLWLR